MYLPVTIAAYFILLGILIRFSYLSINFCGAFKYKNMKFFSILYWFLVFVKSSHQPASVILFPQTSRYHEWCEIGFAPNIDENEINKYLHDK